MEKNKVLLILERSNGNLTVDKESGDYVLEGIFAQFGVENNNKRIYEEKEYLPHLEYLKKKISENRLMGELDHPEKFEVSLDKVSHVIESLDYDSKSRQIKGRVRILDTPAGKIARALVDSGVPVSISSRAAGTVDESKKVNIKRIFTYDLVADPGFEDAQLARVNESFGLESDDNVQIFDASAWNFAYDKETVATNENVEETNSKENNSENMKESYVTVESMNNYSVIIKETIEKLEKKIDSLNEATDKPQKEDIDSLKEQVSNLIGYSNELASGINENRGYAEHLKETINNTIDYSEKEVGSKVDQIIEYVNEEVTPHVDKIIEHNNHIAEKLNTHINYVDDEIATTLDESLKHNDYLAEEIEKNRAYSEFISENAVSTEKFNELVEYSEFMFESFSAGSTKDGKSKDISEETENKETAVEESTTKTGDIQQRATEISNNIDAVLEQINKEKIDSISESSRYPFLTLINEENRATFTELDETQKEKVKTTLLETKSFDKAVLDKAFESALVEKDDTPTDPKWLANAPENFKAIYESLNDSAKNKLHVQAAWYSGKLDSDYQIQNFWQTRGLSETVKPEVNDVLNENKEETKVVNQPGTVNPSLGYSANKISAIKESLNRFK